MFGTVVEYHYLKVDKNESKTNECVYDYLLKNYKIKGLTKENLMDLFGEESTIKGVSTKQIEAFCDKYNIALYCLKLTFESLSSLFT